MLNEIKDEVAGMSTTEKTIYSSVLVVSMWMLWPVGIAVVALFMAIAFYSSVMVQSVPAWGIGLGSAALLTCFAILVLMRGPARSSLLGFLWMLAKGSIALLVLGSLATLVLRNLSLAMPPIQSVNSGASAATAVASKMPVMMFNLVDAYAWIAIVVVPVIAAGISVAWFVSEIKNAGYH